MITTAGKRLRLDLQGRDIIPLIGVYDVFSASVAGRHFDGIFVSGFSFAASYYGLPDAGYIAWPDIVAFVQRVRTILPQHHIVVDIDDGYADVEVACHVVKQLEALGASGVVLEDQQRPRKCGHLDGKQIMELDDFEHKLRRVLDARDELFVVARTDATDPDEAVRRAHRFAAAGADAVLVEGVRDFDLLRRLRSQLDCHLVFIAGETAIALEEILDATRERPILTVSDRHGYGERGVLINLFVQDDRVRFEINRQTALSSGLEIRAKLYRAARLVGEGER